MSFRVTGCKTLFQGQRQARGHHECETCGRSIGPGEVYWTRVVLFKLPDSYHRQVTQRKSCCRGL